VGAAVCANRVAGAENTTSNTANKQQHRNTAGFIRRPLRCIDSAVKSHTTMTLADTKGRFNRDKT